MIGEKQSFLWNISSYSCQRVPHPQVHISDNTERTAPSGCECARVCVWERETHTHTHILSWAVLSPSWDRKMRCIDPSKNRASGNWRVMSNPAPLCNHTLLHPSDHLGCAPLPPTAHGNDYQHIFSNSLPWFRTGTETWVQIHTSCVLEFHLSSNECGQFKLEAQPLERGDSLHGNWVEDCWMKHEGVCVFMWLTGEWDCEFT